MDKTLKKTLYILTLLGLVIVSVVVFFLIKVHELTLYSDFILITIFDFMILALVGVLKIFFYKNSKFLTWFGILFISLIVMLNYAPEQAFQEDLHFYFYLSLGASIILLASVVGNITKIEKKQDEGFEIYGHSKKSILKNVFVIIGTWIGVFFLMGLLVGGLGHTFIGYPKFAVGTIGGSLVSSFGVADWENILMLLLPYALTYAVVYHFTKNKFLAIICGIIVGTIVFSIYHTIIYETNVGAMIGLILFSLIGLLTYVSTESAIILSAMHIGNNFWGNLFKKSVYAFQTYSNVKTSGFEFFTIELLIICILLYRLYLCKEKDI